LPSWQWKSQPHPWRRLFRLNFIVLMPAFIAYHPILDVISFFNIGVPHPFNGILISPPGLSGASFRVGNQVFVSSYNDKRLRINLTAQGYKLVKSITSDLYSLLSFTTRSYPTAPYQSLPVLEQLFHRGNRERYKSDLFPPGYLRYLTPMALRASAARRKVSDTDHHP